MKNILYSLLVVFFVAFLSSCGDKKTGENTPKDSTKAIKKDSNTKVEDKKDTVTTKISEKKDTTSTVRQTEKTQVEEP